MVQEAAATRGPVEAFIERWQRSSAAERANFQSFIKELCAILDVPAPDPATGDPDDRYCFEYAVTFRHGDGSSSTGRIDLYKRGAFVMEAKQGSDQTPADQLPLFGGTTRSSRKGSAVRGTRTWDNTMQRARGQAEGYAKALPVEHGWPPFLVIVDVGHCFELYADFSLTGKNYSQFPDAQSFRIRLQDLADPEIRARLKTVWTDPLALDPGRRAAQVTAEVSKRLAVVARSLEADGYQPEDVAGFLMRCLFSMFAEDVGLLPRKCFTNLLEEMRGRDAKQFVIALETLWTDMDKGSPFSGIAHDPIMRFNGGLFQTRKALPLNPELLGLMIDAAKADWRHVEPAIFGTFLEQALDPRERQKLGAEFTPRRWVERLVMPTIIEPLREQWDNVKATALAYGLAQDHDRAVDAVKTFHHELCHLRILDPACGTGNFLYVTMEHLKRLEGEVLDFLRNDLEEAEATLELERFTVDPHQFLGIELNPRAAQIAEVVLWIGYLQWHFRTKGRVMPAEPVLRNFKNIENRDALIVYDREEIVRDERGEPVTRWDGHSMKTDPVTGREVPDDTRRAPVMRYVNPRPAQWPEADYIIGNPPFTGGKDLRERLGGYVEALWKAYPDMPRSADLVMFWWRRAADLVRTAKTRRFGLITTNSLPQTFNRRVVAAALSADPPLGLVFAIPDHPWYLDGGMASVRIAMTVGARGKQEGHLFRVIDPQRNAAKGGDELRPPLKGLILSNLSIGVDLDQAKPLRANEGLACPGVKLHGSGFIVSPERARQLGLGRIPGLERHIRPYRNGRDLTSRPRGVMVIDLFGLTEGEVRSRFPEVFQHVYEHVRPERNHNNRATYRDNWWIFGEPRRELRPALEGLKRYIATIETARHRVFLFLDSSILPDNKMLIIAMEDSYKLGVLTSRIHVAYAIAAGGRLGVGNDPVYVKTCCFDPFPFPDANEAQKQVIRELAEELDSHRRWVLEEHEELTLTGLYNVLEALKEGRALTAKEQRIHDLGLVSVMKHLHERIDEAVAEAYGWPVDLSEEEVLARLVALNKERRAEEAKGHVRWLRPEFQAPAAKRIEVSEQGEMAIEAVPGAASAKAKKPAWPKAVPEQIRVVRDILAEQPAPLPLDAIATRFRRRPKKDLEIALTTLVALGLARRDDHQRYTA